MKPKDLFTLAVRLLGLYFLACGLKDLDVPAFADVTILKGDNADDVISTLLPVVFNLAVAWWLLRSKFLIQLVYPEQSNSLEASWLPAEAVAPVSPSVQSPALTELELAEKKLAALMAKPKGDAAAR